MMADIHKAFEADLQKRLNPLLVRLNKLEGKLEKLMQEAIRNGKTTTIYWNTIKVEMNKIYTEMNTAFANWSKQNIPLKYKNSLRAINARISTSKNILNKASKNIYKLINSNASSQIMQSLYRSAVDSFSQGLLLGRKNMYDLIRITQQTLINESLIDITVAAGFELGDLRIAANAISGQLWDKLLDAVDNQQFVQAGPFKYTPEYYAELVARTKFHDAQSSAALMQASNYGTDLIQVSTHNTTTEICQQYEGKIYSISGKDKRFPILRQVSPYHPNCLHLMFPTFESAMIVQGTLESFSAFSLGNINRPPVPSNFIPISKRKIA